MIKDTNVQQIVTFRIKNLNKDLFRHVKANYNCKQYIYRYTYYCSNDLLFF